MKSAIARLAVAIVASGVSHVAFCAPAPLPAPPVNGQVNAGSASSIEGWAPWKLPARMTDENYYSAMEKAADKFAAGSIKDLAVKVTSAGESAIEDAEACIESTHTLAGVMTCYREKDAFYDTLLQVYSDYRHDYETAHPVPKEQNGLKDAVGAAYGSYLLWTTASLAPKILEAFNQRLASVVALKAPSPGSFTSKNHAIISTLFSFYVNGRTKYEQLTEAYFALRTVLDAHNYPLKSPFVYGTGLPGLLAKDQFEETWTELQQIVNGAETRLSKAQKELTLKLESHGETQTEKSERESAIASIKLLRKLPEIDSGTVERAVSARKSLRNGYAFTSDFFFYGILDKFLQIQKYEAILPTYHPFVDDYKDSLEIIIENLKEQCAGFRDLQTTLDRLILKSPNGKKSLDKIYAELGEFYNPNL